MGLATSYYYDEMQKMSHGTEGLTKEIIEWFEQRHEMMDSEHDSEFEVCVGDVVYDKYGKLVQGPDENDIESNLQDAIDIIENESAYGWKSI